ncbi:alpha/beta family hydrolase [Trinickia caryophylli]|uniref:Dienelactone hydrolase n=1 Tax=Trinickia caryophylli TaxID=28094 RepID=A0A1X7HA97_TRICW|nr:alpha/beta family hydrolase [Trinickia caryophylli]PMS08994.1 hydrolase [Trinickia caryophylli]TRX15033.1 alpha/beta hydrolase [Trinickia caryophylli]WQE14891.1 alpha/beta family hydrolase [Trinickia caryophylli]SMF82109.1 Dienelactone hydrolase [Trinickia caryophylli]GLU35788.1 hydrolase [Trinickia caryophylli]
MQSREVEIGGDYVALAGMLTVPERAVGVVAFAHGSGSSRLSPRNRDVAGVLQQAGLATLLFDLLTAEEYRHDVFSAEYRFNIPLLSRRLSVAIDWLRQDSATAALPLGLFGASTGAAAALCAAATKGETVRAVVSRGGRPDLAREALAQVNAPTLLIVGEFDPDVIRLNEQAAAQLHCEHKIEIVPGATHLFEEPGTLETVSVLAANWFVSHLGGGG